MTMEQLLAVITPEIHQALKTAIELGKWADGRALTKAQVEHCLQAVIAYEHRSLPEEQRIGYIADNACRKQDQIH